MLGRLGTIILLVVWIGQMTGVAPSGEVAVGDLRSALSPTSLPGMSSAEGIRPELAEG